jgi:hypothetical protein
VKERADECTLGTLNLIFFIRRDGKVEGIRVTSNASNKIFAGVCVRAIKDAAIPPIPEELSLLLPKGRMKFEIKFTLN